MSSTIPHTLPPLSLCVRPLCFCGFLWSEPRPTMQSSVQFSCSVVSDILLPHGLQHGQTSLTITNSQRLYKLMSIALVTPSNHLILCRPLLLLRSIFPSIKVFSNELVLHIRWPSIGASASASVLPRNVQDWFPLGWTGLISLQSNGLSRVFSNTTVQKHQLFCVQLSL